MWDQSNHSLSTHSAHVLAAKLREAGVYATGREVLSWPYRTMIRAKRWAYVIEPQHGRGSWETWMGPDLPPPSPHNWLTLFAPDEPTDETGTKPRAGNE